MAEFDTPQEEAACTMLKQVLQNHIATYNLSFIGIISIPLLFEEIGLTI